jgi:hypothetical protein
MLKKPFLLMNLMQRAQTSFEYVLIVGGIIMLVVVAYMLVRGGVLAPTGNQTQFRACQSRLTLQYDKCYSNNVWNCSGVVSCTLCENFPFKGASPSPSWGPCPDATDPAKCYCGPKPA